MFFVNVFTKFRFFFVLIINIFKFLVEDDQEIVVEEYVEYTDLQLVPILNDFVFSIFVGYFILLNAGLLVLFPAVVKKPMTMND